MLNITSTLCMIMFCFNLTFIYNFYFIEPQFYRLEGVWLTESGMSLLRSISMSPLHKRRQRRSRLGTLCSEGGPDGIDLREVEGEGDDGKGWHIFAHELVHVFRVFCAFYGMLCYFVY